MPGNEDECVTFSEWVSSMKDHVYAGSCKLELSFVYVKRTGWTLRKHINNKSQVNVGGRLVCLRPPVYLKAFWTG